MKTHKARHPRFDFERLYASRKKGRRGPASIEVSVDALTQRLGDYVEKHKAGLMTATKNDTDNMMTNRMIIISDQKLEENKLYGHFKKRINDISNEKTWTWLRKENFKRATESHLIAEQNNAIRTHQVKARMDKMQQRSKCRLSGNRDETTDHIISECSKLAQNEYNTRHAFVGNVIH